VVLSLKYHKNYNGVVWNILRLLVGCIILTAAILKAYQLTTTPDLRSGLLHARWFNITVVEFELLFGIWLLSGLLQKLAWLVSLILFTGFAGISLYKAAVLQELSCGCFGAVHVNPFVTFLLDGGIVALLIIFRPKCEIVWLRLQPQILLNYVLIFVPLGCFVLWETSQVQFQQLQGIEQHLQDGNLVKLEPQMWLDKEFPLRRYCDIGEDLAMNRWLVLLHRTGCTECRKASPLIVKLAKERNCPLVVLEMNSTDDVFHIDNMESTTGLLSQKITWFAETPIVLELNDGVVKQVLLREDLRRMQLENKQQPVLLFGKTD
jgi:thiol-disulfide isomerase/thioredoxin